MSKITGRPISVTVDGETYEIKSDILMSIEQRLPEELKNKIGKNMSMDFIHDNGKCYRVISKVEKIFEV